MSAAGAYWVSPHAVKRFRQRIAPLPENLALAAIIKALADPTALVKPQGDGRTVRIRTRAPHKFRAFVVAARTPDELPAVTTIFEG